MKTHIDHLKAIKSKLHANKMSVMIGAGFSKNVDPRFLSWYELLQDIVLYLYADEIEEKCISRKIRSQKEKDNLKKKQIERIVEREGYLGIVSQYIKRKGFREAIEVFIESYTPCCNKEGKKIILKGIYKGKPFEDELTRKDFSAHINLLQLPWNNVYTTNYDNLLESVVNPSIEQEIKKEREYTEKELKSLYQRQELTINELISLDEKIAEIELFLSEYIDATNPMGIKTTLSIPDSQIKDKQDKRTKLFVERGKQRFELMQTERNIKDKEIARINLEQRLSQCFTTVTESAELGLKRNKNIIKLHGDLRTTEKSKFGFDGDNQRHYIIASEDYDKYPFKHEAFTQLMRISLLQESYCLLGFSGTDPNFIAWLSWVRDIIERKEKDAKDDYKIYLIEVRTDNEKDEITRKGKEAFFHNHHIVKIPIWEPKIIKFLESQTHLSGTDNNDPKQLVNLLFSYLSDGKNINEPEAYIELFKQAQYDKLWREIISKENGSGIKINTKIDASQIEQLSRSKRIPSLSQNRYLNKQDVWESATQLIEGVNEKGKETLAKLLLLAVRDSFLSPGDIWYSKEQDIIFPFLETNGQATELCRSLLREAVLDVNKKLYNELYSYYKDNSVDKDSLIYESILYSAFTLDFDKLKKELYRWQPEKASHWNIKKIGLISLFDAKESEKILAELDEFFQDIPLQEQLYILEIQYYIIRCINPSSPKATELFKKIKEYERLGFKEMMDNFDYLCKEFSRKKEKIQPYGDDRFMVSNNSMSLSRNLFPYQKSVQFVQLMIEHGVPFALPNINLKEAKSWFEISKNLYRSLPYPCLFYSLQINDKKVLRRIAQEYAYSDDLKGKLKDILQKLLKAYLCTNTPIYYRLNILLFASELFIAVAPQYWEKDYYSIWQNLLSQNVLFGEQTRRHNQEVNSFVTKGLCYIKSPEIIRNVINDILDNYPADKNNTIEYLYYLGIDEKKISRSKIVIDKLESKIDSIIERIALHHDENAIFIIGNLHKMLSEEQKRKAENTIANMDFNHIESTRTWHIILYYIKDTATRKKVKEAISTNKSLWNTGINKNSISWTEFIDLRLLDKNYAYRNGLSWTKDESFVLYTKLKDNFAKIERFKKSYEDSYNFKSILKEMYHFLLNHEKHLKNQTDYASVRQRLEEIYFKDREYTTIISALLSEDQSVIIWGLDDLFYDIYCHKNIEDKYVQEISVLINKILLKKEPALEASIQGIARLVENEKNNQYLKSIAQLFILILEKYISDNQDFDKPFLYNNMYRIAKTLKSWKIENDIIDDWIKLCKSNNFNNVLKNFQ